MKCRIANALGGLLMLTGAATAGENAQEAAKTACALAAFTEYNQANVALMLGSGQAR
jgi:hypothetical protein